MNWDVICFDLDNTLYNYEMTFEKTIEFCFENLSDRYGYPADLSFDHWFPVFKYYCDLYWPMYSTRVMTRDQYRQKRYLDSLKEFHVKADNEHAQRLQALFNKNVHHFVVHFDGMKSFLEELKYGHQKIGVITNGKTEIQYNKLKKLGFLPFFQENDIIISDTVNASKPGTTIFKIAEQRLGNENDRFLYIGDSWELDIEGARNAKWDAIYFNSRHEKMNYKDKMIKEVTSIEGLIKAVTN